MSSSICGSSAPFSSTILQRARHNDGQLPMPHQSQDRIVRVTGRGPALTSHNSSHIVWCCQRGGLKLPLKGPNLEDGPHYRWECHMIFKKRQGKARKPNRHHSTSSCRFVDLKHVFSYSSEVEAASGAVVMSPITGACAAPLSRCIRCTPSPSSSLCALGRLSGHSDQHTGQSAAKKSAHCGERVYQSRMKLRRTLHIESLLRTDKGPRRNLKPLLLTVLKAEVESNSTPGKRTTRALSKKPNLANAPPHCGASAWLAAFMGCSATCVCEQRFRFQPPGRWAANSARHVRQAE